jgi:glycosyltransferase involved in cell wall biosynthesis
MDSETSQAKRDVLVLLPCLNEFLTIAQTVNSIRELLPDSEILVIDNGSTDDTVKVALSCGVSVVHEPRRGKGFAVRAGIERIQKNTKAVFMVDADDTYGLENLKYSIDQVILKGYDMVVGNRNLKDLKSNNRSEAFRAGHQLGNRLFTWLTRLLHPAGIQDTLSGWRVMSPRFLLCFPGGSSGFEIESELNAHAHLMGSAVMNVDISYRGRTRGSTSKLNTYRDGLRILMITLRTFRNDRPQLAFGILSIPWLFSSIYFNSRAISGYLETGLVPQFPSLMAGVGTFLVFSLLLIAGIILERIKQIRVNMAKYIYRSSFKF